MVDAHGVTDVRAADGAAVVARLKHLAALVAGDHVVAGVEQTVAHVGHADGAVPVHVGRQDGCKSPKSHAGIDHPHALVRMAQRQQPVFIYICGTIIPRSLSQTSNKQNPTG